MGVVTSYYSVPQDPMFGIGNGNIVSRLTRRNWKTKAVTRLHPDGPVCTFINRGERKVSGRKTFVYTVKGSIVDKQQGCYRRGFIVLLKDFLFIPVTGFPFSWQAFINSKQIILRISQNSLVPIIIGPVRIFNNFCAAFY